MARLVRSAARACQWRQDAGTVSTALRRTLSAETASTISDGELEGAREELREACRSSEKAGRQLNWIFQGPPGVGKGTYAKKAAVELGVPHIATGDLLRGEVAAGTELGRELEPALNSGQLIGDEQMEKLVAARLRRGIEQGERGFLLDGFPRSIRQARFLSNNSSVMAVLRMTMREDVLVEKCCGRRVCSHCGANYNLADISKGPGLNGEPPVRLPPLPPESECEPHLFRRSDDTEEVVRERLKLHRENVRPFIPLSTLLTSLFPFWLSSFLFVPPVGVWGGVWYWRR